MKTVLTILGLIFRHSSRSYHRQAYRHINKNPTVLFSTTRKFLVENNYELNKTVEYLLHYDEIALDLEFDRNMYSYGFNLCLIQIYAGDRAIVVDPRSSKINLDILFRNILENEKILKVIHSPSEDIRLLQSLGCYTKPIFDTERSAKLLNFHETALVKLLKGVLGVHIDKKEQKSNWMLRPLSVSQVEYAMNDVIHLLPLKRKLVEMAKEKGIESWIDDENNDWNLYMYTPKESSGLASSRDAQILTPFQLHVYNAMLQIREKYAEQLSRPPHHILSRDVLLFYARESLSLDSLSLHKAKGIHPIFRNYEVCNEFEETFENAIAEAMKLNLSNQKVKSSSDDESQDDKFIHFLKVREEITKYYGNSTANFILPISLIRKLVSDPQHINQINLPYRRNLIDQIVNGSLPIS